MMKAIAIGASTMVLFVLAATQCSPDTQSSQQTSAWMQREERAIRGLVEQWRKALLENDTEFRARVMAEGFTLTTYDGRVITREQILEYAKSSDYRVVDAVPEEILIRFYGKETAVLNARGQFTEEYGGQRIANKIQVTQFWIKRKGQWSAVAEHATRIGQ